MLFQEATRGMGSIRAVFWGDTFNSPIEIDKSTSLILFLREWLEIFVFFKFSNLPFIADIYDLDHGES